MKPKHIITILLAVTAFACTTKEYDDTILTAKMDVLSKQVAELIQKVNDLNTQVQGFNTVIEQWKAGGFVESIQEVTGGHTIKFVGGQTVTILNGKDGNDGASPVIGIKADTDGVQYWTVNGEFLLVDSKKVPVAVIPVFSTNANGELIVTVNGVETNLGKVSAAGDAIFESVVADADKVTFTLVGGQSFEIPFVKAFKVVIEKIDYTEVQAGEVIGISYTVQNGEGATVMAFAGGAYKAVVNAAEKKVNVTVPNPASDGQVMVWAQTETVTSPIIILNFTAQAGGGEEPASVVIVSQPETYQSIPLAGGEVNVDLTSNVEIEVAPPTVDWVTVNLATKAEYTLTLTLQENTGAPRSTEILINRKDNGENVQKIQIAQLGSGGEDPTPGEATTWDFSSSEWQAALAAQASAACAEENGNTYAAGWTVTLDGLTYTSDAKNAKWSTSGYIQPNGAGSSTDRVFSFTAASDGVLTVVSSNTGESAATGRNVTVLDASGENSQDGGAGSKTPATLKFNVKAGAVKVYPTGGGLRFYKFVFEGGTSGGGESGGEDPTPGESADLECPTPPTVATVDPTQMVGFAAAKGVTGGAGTGAKTYHFNNGKALQTWLLARTKTEKAGDHSPVTIWLSGTFKSDEGRDFSSAHPWFDVKDVSNLSFIGTDSFVMDQIGIFCVRASNIIIRNINFQQPKANNGADAVSMQECDGVWVDHCTFTSLNQTKDYEDGSTDVTHGSKNVTVSWCRYIKTQKSCLVGHSNNQSSDSQISVTFHHNWFDQSSSRHPRVRFGVAHVYNNLYDGCTTYGAGSAYGAKVLVEYNYFDGVQLPTDICTYPAKESNESNLQGSVAGYLYPTQNIYVNRPAKAKDPYPLSNVQYTKYNGSTITPPLTYADFKPAYDYTVTAVEDVPAVVKENAGYGKLGFTEAPIAVDNAGIDEFNGTDEDPVNPDQGDEDEPSEPSGPASYTLYATGSKAIATTGGNYFTYSTDTADFRSPSATSYNGPFTIGGTEYSFGVKLNSSGYVSFTTSATLNTTVQFYFARRKESDSSAKIQLVPAEGDPQEFETPFTTYGDSGEIALEKGKAYTIKQKSSEQGLILVKVTETE